MTTERFNFMKKRKWIVGIMGVVATATIMIGASSVKASASTTSVDMYRLYNAHTGEHFYTSSYYERQSLIAGGWSYEGIGWIAPRSGAPVYRVYNPNAKGGDHYYTKSKYEADSLVSKGWKWDNGAKPVFYSGGNSKVYVAYNPNAQSGSHNYTTNTYEQSSLLKAGWKYGATAWSALGLGKAAPAPAKVVKAEDFQCPRVEFTDGKYYMFGQQGVSTSTKPTSSFQKAESYKFTNRPAYATNLSSFPGAHSQYYNGHEYVTYFNLWGSNGRPNYIAVATSSKPNGPYTLANKPLITVPQEGPNNGLLDPIPFKDGNNLYLVYTRDLNGQNTIRMIMLSSDGRSTAGADKELMNRKTLYNAGQAGRIESPSLMKAPDGTYVLFFSGNWATESNYFTGYATSKSVTGTYSFGGKVMTTGNMKVDGPGEAQAFVHNGQYSLYFNGWVGPHNNSFQILPGGKGRYAYNVGFTWVNGHIPVPDF